MLDGTSNALDMPRIFEFSTLEDLGYEVSGEYQHSLFNEDYMVFGFENQNDPTEDSGKAPFSFIVDQLLHKERMYADDVTEDSFTSSQSLVHKVYAAANKSLQRDSSTILFDEDSVGGFSTPITGDIGFDFAGAKRGVTVSIIHNDSTVPQLPSAAKTVTGSEYITGTDNLLILRYYSDTVVVVWSLSLSASTFQQTAVNGTVDGHTHGNLAILNLISDAGGGVIPTAAQLQKLDDLQAGYLGYFQTSAALVSAYPTGSSGQNAVVGETGTFWIWDQPSSAWIDTEQDDPSNTIPVFSGAGSSGLVPDPVNQQGKFLRDDGTWQSGVAINTLTRDTFDLSAGDITNEYVDLSNIAVENSLRIWIEGQGYQNPNEFTLSTVSNVTRVTWSSTVGATLSAGEDIVIEYFITIGGASSIGVTADEVLTKTNTTVYTPTQDYHPATRLFVVDSIGAKADSSITIQGANSITGGGNLTANRTLQLSGDSASPGNSKYYGTNGSGSKGFFDFPSSGGGGIIDGETSYSAGGTLALSNTNINTYGGKLISISNATGVSFNSNVPVGTVYHFIFTATSYTQINLTLVNSAGWYNSVDSSLPVGKPYQLVRIQKVNSTQFLFEDLGYDPQYTLTVTSSSINLNTFACQGININHNFTSSTNVLFYTSNFKPGDWLTITKISSGGSVTVANGTGFTIYGSATISEQGAVMHVFCPINGTLVVTGGE